ncbi:MAG: hypothetical protein ACLTBZ_03380 [Faecalispora jeddahensis]|uniref:hypothetical protein n=1 Tax=Faecalispora jeddahensis TaxID=1414721 RepID=UPI003994281E
MKAGSKLGVYNAVIMAFMEKPGQTSDEMFTRHANIECSLRAIVKQLKNEHSFFKQWVLSEGTQGVHLTVQSEQWPLLVGFCGETAADFKETAVVLKLLDYKFFSGVIECSI